MSLENIQLPGAVLKNLFRKSLVIIESGEPNDTTAKEVPFSWLGEHRARVAIIVNSDNDVYLPGDDLEFLSGVLSACKLTIADTAIINVKNYPDLSSQHIDDHLSPTKLIIFGVDPPSIRLPFNIPHFQVQTFNGKQYVFSPPLQVLRQDKPLKTSLWKALQQLFDLKK
jgi:hypothetical protein